MFLRETILLVYELVVFIKMADSMSDVIIGHNYQDVGVINTVNFGDNSSNYSNCSFCLIER